MTDAGPEAVLEFWLGESNDLGLPRPETRRRWFEGGARFDAEVRDRFGPTLEAALRGDLDAWCETPRGRLALVIVLDQMTRNAFRGSSRAFAGDARARELVRTALEAGGDASLTPAERYFLYMPLMHAEDPRLQEESVARFRALAEADPEPGGGMLSGGVRWAEGHRREIERFGRFPGRNAALGRENTAEERSFLAESS